MRYVLRDDRGHRLALAQRLSGLVAYIEEEELRGRSWGVFDILRSLPGVPVPRETVLRVTGALVGAATAPRN